MKKLVYTFTFLLASVFANAQQPNATAHFFTPQQPQFEHFDFQQSDFEHFDMPVMKKQNNELEWWEPDTICLYDTNSEITSRYIFNYNQQGFVTLWLSQTWTDDGWVNHFRNTYTFDSNNNCLSNLSELWTNEAWKNYSRNTYTYDSNNNLLSRLYENWANEAWANSSLRTYTYDSNNNLLSFLRENWTNDNWVNSSQNTYTYDSNNNRLSLLTENWTNEAWLNDSRRTYTYDSNNNQLSDLSELWANEAWLNNSRETYTYDSNNNLLSNLYETWTNENWVNYWQYTYTYDSNNNCNIGEIFIWQEGEWRAASNAVALYYNNMQSSSTEFNCHKATATYKKYNKLGIPEETPKPTTVTVYPNPVKDNVIIKLEPHSQSTVTLYDILGRELSTLTARGNTQIALNHLPAGIYILKIENGGNVEKLRVVKE